MGGTGVTVLVQIKHMYFELYKSDIERYWGSCIRPRSSEGAVRLVLFRLRPMKLLEDGGDQQSTISAQQQ